MVPYHFHPTLLLRAPVYNYTFYSDENLSLVLKDKFFQKAIYFSSEAFYNELEKADFELSKLEKRAVSTLKKYFNRMCFRPTPFGLCSAFGTTTWSQNADPIMLDTGNFKRHIQFSFAKNLAYANTLLSAYKGEVTYNLNPTFYNTGNEYRYIKASYDNPQVEFIIDSLQADRFFKALIKFLGSERTKTAISTYVCLYAKSTAEQAENYTTWLIDNQVIISTLEANITGEDYLPRLIDHIHGNKNTDYGDTKYDFNITDSIKAVNQLGDILTIPNCKSEDYYVNLEVKTNTTGLSKKYQEDILDGLHCLDHFTASQQSSGLNEFIRRFSQKFDGQTLPLLKALDPEIGVGYGDLATEENIANIAANLVSPAAAESKAMVWSNAHALLFTKWQNKPGSTISITVDDLLKLKRPEDTCPPNFSVMFRVVDDKVLLESSGGICASSLIGRFTPLNDEIKQAAIEIAEHEALYKPDVLFAEIAHICHNRTANIDRREHIYPYEIPVLVQSPRPVEQQIPLDDLHVSVRGGSIILQSKKHGKRVIPRLSSAFNYARNDLAVFRFLCDLQKASVKTNFSLKLNYFFPDLEYYPRVEYKNAILHLAYWNMNKGAFKDILKAKEAEQVVLFNDIRYQFKLPKHIALTQYDHQLVFDLDKPADVLFFLDNIKTLNQFTVKEFPLPSGQNQVIISDSGQHINQFVALLYQRQQVYKDLILPVINSEKSIIKHIPGSEWVYVKIYCHAIRSNQLLIDLISPSVKKLLKKGVINQWFFIRYYDPEHHIRLRLKVNGEQQQQALADLKAAVKGCINDGTINSYTLATYEPEFERYSYQYMPQFERGFYNSSDLVTRFLHRQSGVVSTIAIIQFAMVTMSDILTGFELEGDKKIIFLESVFNTFSNEFSGIIELKYQLDIEFRKQKGIIENALNNGEQYYSGLKLAKARGSFIESLAHLKQAITQTDTWKEKWVADIIHMHLNRLFINDSRKQEMMVYYFLLKHERSLKGRLKSK